MNYEEIKNYIISKDSDNLIKDVKKLNINYKNQDVYELILKVHGDIGSPIFYIYKDNKINRCTRNEWLEIMNLLNGI